jgi:hypothetical protein
VCITNKTSDEAKISLLGDLQRLGVDLDCCQNQTGVINLSVFKSRPMVKELLLKIGLKMSGPECKSEHYGDLDYCMTCFSALQK